MVRIYRYVLVTIMIGLIIWGVWYVLSKYSERRSYNDGILVMVELEVENGTGNRIY